MERDYTEGQTFKNLDFKQNPLPRSTYEDCTFINCDFSGVILSGFEFADCSFSGCNLSLTPVEHTAFRQVTFRDCKMLGLRFDQCNPFGFSLSLERCNLSHASFYKVKMKKTRFIQVILEEADCTEADLSGSVLDRCELQGAIFDQTNLEQADLRSAVNYSLDPARNRLKKAKFGLSGVPGLLLHHQIMIDPAL
jgi:fluoroquinolone resistance protein